MPELSVARMLAQDIVDWTQRLAMEAGLECSRSGHQHRVGVSGCASLLQHLADFSRHDFRMPPRLGRRPHSEERELEKGRRATPISASSEAAG